MWKTDGETRKPWAKDEFITLMKRVCITYPFDDCVIKKLPFEYYTFFSKIKRSYDPLPKEYWSVRKYILLTSKEVGGIT